MRAVNLLPGDQNQGSLGSHSTPVLVGACVGLLVAALLAMMFMTKSGQVAAEQRKVDDLRTALAATPAPPGGPTAAQTQLAGEHSARVTALSTALSSRVAWDRVLRQFSLVLPDDVWLTTLSVKSPISPASNVSTTSSVPSGFSFTGRTYSHDSVARLLSRMQVVPDLTNVQLVSSSLVSFAGQDVVEFSILADIRSAPPAVPSS